MFPAQQLYAELLSSILLDHPPQVDSEWVGRVISAIQGRSPKWLATELGRTGKMFDSFLSGNGLISRDGEMPTLFAELVENQPDWGPNSANVVKYVRQVCYFLYKLELLYSKEQEQSVLDRYMRNEEELHDLMGADWEHLALGRAFIRRVFADFNPRNIRPRNGPGVVSTGERLDDKWRFRRIYDGINQYYSFHDYFRVGVGGVPELEDVYRLDGPLENLPEGFTLSMFVPKDARGPRFIAAEPLEYQYIQQGLGRAIVDWVESHKLTSRHINFRDQTINRTLSLEGSVNGEWATIDLRDASDRVSLSLVRYLWQDLPDMLAALEAARSGSTILPNGRTVRLLKYAPMGSALCFPVLALTVAAVLVSALRHDVSKTVPFFVYGDDVIVRTVDVERAVQWLESAGLAVNLSKSCFKGYFRESCGMDAFAGEDVTPVRAKVLWTNDKNDAAQYEHYVALSNHLERRGWLETANLLWRRLETFYGFIPWGVPETSFPCRHVVSRHDAELRNKRVRGLRHRYYVVLQYHGWRVRTIESKHVESTLDGADRLLRNLLLGGHEEFDPSFLEIRHSSKIKWRWSAV